VVVAGGVGLVLVEVFDVVGELEAVFKAELVVEDSVFVVEEVGVELVALLTVGDEVVEEVGLVLVEVFDVVGELDVVFDVDVLGELDEVVLVIGEVAATVEPADAKVEPTRVAALAAEAKLSNTSAAATAILQMVAASARFRCIT
jgi:hypothetical protein